jgi:hypothetical protein
MLAHDLSLLTTRIAPDLPDLNVGACPKKFYVSERGSSIFIPGITAVVVLSQKLNFGCILA